jgi:hypothetical protein
MRILIFAIGLFTATGASASCALVTGPCSTDSYGNTYRTEQNLGGGYNTYRNGSLHSQTSQQLNGNYRETFTGGGHRTYDRDPYASSPTRNGLFD